MCVCIEVMDAGILCLSSSQKCLGEIETFLWNIIHRRLVTVTEYLEKIHQMIFFSARFLKFCEKHESNFVVDFSYDVFD